MRRIILASLAAILLSFPLQSRAVGVSAPSFLNDIRSQADVDKLTPAQQQELSLYLDQNGQNVSDTAPTDATPSVTTDGSTSADAATPAPAGTVNCFDYYHFGSVQVDVTPTVSSVVAGVPVTFQGTIVNGNDYPVTDGSVFVKIFRKSGSDAASVQRNGYQVVDAFFAKENIVAAGKQSVPLSFEWKVPRNISAGDYEADFYFMTGKRFNLLGLSFTDDVTGNKTPFSVKSDMPATPEFDKNNVKLNGKEYSFAAAPLRFGKSDPVNADVFLKNPSAESRVVNVVWTLSNWSGEREENRLDRKTEAVTLAPNENKSLRYVADPSKSIGSVTVLTAEATYQDTKSILGIRFIRDGFDEVRLNFPGVLNYPIRRGESATLFSCLHATNADVVKGGELLLTLTDSFGTVLDSYTYQGDITGAMMGVKHDFTPKTSAATFILRTELKKDGKIVETYETKYDCKDIDPASCPLDVQPGMNSLVGSVFGSGTPVRILALLFVLIPLGLVLWFLVRRRKGAGVFVFLLIGSSILFAAPHGAEAKSVTWNKVTDTLLYRRMIYGEDFVFSAPSSTGTLTMCIEGKVVARNGGVSTLGMYQEDSYQVEIYKNTTGQCGGIRVTKDMLFTTSSNGATFSRDGDSMNLSAIDVGTYTVSASIDGLSITVGVNVTESPGRWPSALKNSNVSITYNARMIDAATGREYHDGDNVFVGSKVRFEPIAFQNTDISWFGTGMSYDTPFGHWQQDASAPPVQCYPEEEMSDVERQYGLAGYTHVYIPFMVDPPSVSYTHSGSAQLSCNGSGAECLVQSSGTIGATVDFGNTFGQFYFRRIMEGYDNSACKGNNTPLSLAKKFKLSTLYYPFKLQVPKTSVPFSLNAVSPSAPPTDPVVTGPVSGLISQPYDFTATSTDPDGDTLRYGFDWNKDGQVDQWVPGTGYVASGSAQTADYSWTVIGVKSFQVLAEDKNGSRSGFTPYSITVADGNFRMCVESLQVNAGQTRDLQMNAIGDTRNLTAYYDTGTGCSGTNVTTSQKTTIVSANSSIVSVLPNDAVPNTKRLRGEAVGGPIPVTATYGTSAPAVLRVTVPKVCVSDCAASGAANVCKGKTFVGSCGENCQGTQSCDQNWKEVAPTGN
ncbi:MAG: hypothetical protein WCL23_03870 [Candidatus Moraniibacteriota bacterium]